MAKVVPAKRYVLLYMADEYVKEKQGDAPWKRYDLRVFESDDKGDADEMFAAVKDECSCYAYVDSAKWKVLDNHLLWTWEAFANKTGGDIDYYDKAKKPATLCKVLLEKYFGDEKTMNDFVDEGLLERRDRTASDGEVESWHRRFTVSSAAATRAFKKYMKYLDEKWGKH